MCTISGIRIQKTGPCPAGGIGSNKSGYLTILFLFNNEGNQNINIEYDK